MKLLLMILAVITLLTPATVAAQTNGTSEGHFKCYGANGLPPSPNPHVFLSDQFEETEATVFEPIMLCNPAIKSHDNEVPGIATIIPSTQHLVCYLTREVPRRFETREVQVSNQFGYNQDLKISKRAMLCVPSCKDEECNIVLPPPLAD
jgi:hypothetical protein